MGLEAGSRIGPYEIVSRVGAGGMGEVFRARDTRLGRTVALKTLPAQFAQSAQLRLRLQREAKAISSLTHPHICALYDIGEEQGVDYLVMEYLEGETLADRVSKGPLPLDEALRYAIEIAEALEVAHREGVIHRDLKPGNVILTRTGAKLLDFGLARTAAEAAPVTADAPTMQAQRDQPLTAEGTIVGTFQYMAPEQLEGQPADARTDIFAFGAVLYEMITGRRAFDGKTKTSIIAAIVSGTPQPISTLRPIAPRALEHVVQRCLDKDPEARWQSAHDVRIELEWIAREQETPQAGRARPASRLPWLVAAVAAAVAIGAGVLALRETPDRTAPLRMHVLAPPGKELGFVIPVLSVSPDGRYMTFGVRGDTRLWLRAMDSPDARPIEGTENAEFPFWSPDSRWIAFGDGKKLKKVGLSGAPPATLADAPRARGGAWGADGTILFAPDAISGIHRIDPDGTSRALTQLDPKQRETTHRWPVLLPDGNRFLYLAGAHSELASSELNAVYLSSIDAPQKRTLLLRARSNVRYARGHLLYVKDNVLVAHPFDPRRGELRGEPFRVADRIGYHAGYFCSAFTASDAGMIVYRSSASRAGRLAWVVDGRLGEPYGEPMAIQDITVSPDGRRAVVSVANSDTDLDSLWLIDVTQDRRTRLTSTTTAQWKPVWAPDNRRIVFARGAGYAAGGELTILDVDSGAEKTIFSEPNVTPYASDWSKDGRWILFARESGPPVKNSDLYVIPAGGGPARPVVQTAGADELAGVFSPDSTRIAYLSTESGRPQAYATTFPQPAARIEIASMTVHGLDWTGEGVILASEGKIYVVPVTDRETRIAFGTPRKVADTPPNALDGWVVDSRRQLVAVGTRDPYAETLTVTTRWERPKQ